MTTFAHITFYLEIEFSLTNTRTGKIERYKKVNTSLPIITLSEYIGYIVHIH